MMNIIVPSIRRAGACNSMRWLRDSERKIIFAVHKDEADVYHKAYHTEILTLSDDCRHHTGLVRREIMGQIREPFFFVDDDIRISLKGLPTICSVFDLLEHHMRCGTSMVGLAPQLFSNFANTVIVNGDPYVVQNRFVATVYGIDPRDFDECPLEKLAVYEDVALVIHAIQQKRGTIVTYAATHSNVSPPVGGCNSWRNAIITVDCLNKLVELYPDVCSIKSTNNTTHSQNIGIGLRTAWSKIKKLNASV